MPEIALLKIEPVGDTVLVTPSTDLSELAFEQIEAEAEEIFTLLEQPEMHHVVIDFQQTDYYGSTALSFFVKLWKRLRDGGGNIAFCNVSAHEQEILNITKLDTLWPICESRAEAMAQVAS